VEQLIGQSSCRLGQEAVDLPRQPSRYEQMQCPSHWFRRNREYRHGPHLHQ
jgi:hypothetical protein